MKAFPAVFALALVWLNGCSTPTKKPYPNEQQPGDASLRVENIGFGDAMTGGVLVGLDEIDGLHMPTWRKGIIWFLRPGKHELAISAASALLFKSGRQFLEVALESNHQYRLTADKLDDDYAIDLTDETDPKLPKLVQRFKVRAGASHILPIPIPVKD